jgi:hypothetical protein
MPVNPEKQRLAAGREAIHTLLQSTSLDNKAKEDLRVIKVSTT